MEICKYITKLFIGISLVCLILLMLDYLELKHIEGTEDHNSSRSNVSQKWGDRKGFGKLKQSFDSIRSLQSPGTFEDFFVEGKSSHNSSRSNTGRRNDYFVEAYGPKRVLDNPDTDVSYMNTMG